MRARHVVIGLTIVLVGMWVLVAALFMSVNTAGDSVLPAANLGCGLKVDGAVTPVTLDAEQTANARAILDVAETDGVPMLGWVVALATALQESELHNMGGGDRDSAGVFQQRPSQGWGTYADVTDIEYEALAFFGGPNRPADDSNSGLLDIPGWQSMPVTVAAQAVQHSAFPDAYAKWEDDAYAIMLSLAGANISAPCATLPALDIPPGTVGTFLTFVASKIGDWYLWGATGPDRFDCSGLIFWAWASAGHPMADRTAAQMWADSTRVPAGQEQPGDLLFSEFDTRVSGPGHVAVIVSPGVAIEAPHTGAQVREIAYTITGDKQVGRLSGAAFTGGWSQ